MSSFNKEQVLEILGYNESSNYQPVISQHHPMTAHLFRSAGQAGAEGVYLFKTSDDDQVLPPRPAVFIAEAKTSEEARKIHQSLWNLGHAPFLIVILPNQLRVYTGFHFDRTNQKAGLIDVIETIETSDLKKKLADYQADSIDSGKIWANQANQLDVRHRLDVHLLNNLRKLDTLLTQKGLDQPIAHALIGKYVYLEYLRDRNILSPQWLEENEIDINSVYGPQAHLKGLQKLIELLDDRFNGHIFPFPLSGKNAPTDKHVSIVASAFEGTDVGSGQLPLFDLYDFSYIPVETLSSIYEQFLHAQGKGKKEGAVYTPEYLADYLIAELNSVKPLEKGMKVLDPCCGSGIFLVLAYRKLIELELQNRNGRSLRPSELREILTTSIFGVERDVEACYVTELSLTLTMLHYISAPELHRNKQFKFPELHNKQIFQADFFDDSSQFWEQKPSFDWVIGNPPWIKPKKNEESERFVLSWVDANQENNPVGGNNRVVEAFSWRVGEVLEECGCVGLVLHATSLFNHKSKAYRQKFFQKYTVHCVTNLSNLRSVLFHGRATAPTAIFIYTRTNPDQEKPPIIHHGPLLVNQSLDRAKEIRKVQKTWALTIHGDEIRAIEPRGIETGDSLVWKLALWGGNRDKRAMQRLKRLFPMTLEDLRLKKGWSLHQGLVLGEKPENLEDLKLVREMPQLIGSKYFDAKEMKKTANRFSLPQESLKSITAKKCFIRLQSGQSSLNNAGDVSIIFNPSYSVFVDQKFILCEPLNRLTAPLQDANYLRALSVYLSSSFAKYFLFFLSPIWGIERDIICKKDIEQIPLPNFTDKQIAELALLQQELVAKEERRELNTGELQDLLDEKIEAILNLPKTVSILVRDFVRFRLPLVGGGVASLVKVRPSEVELTQYATLLRDQLDEFTRGRAYHKVSFIQNSDQELLICVVEITESNQPFDVCLNMPEKLSNLSWSRIQSIMKQRFSQWVYVQRELRIFDGPKVYICKPSRRIDWTMTEALNDSDDLIAEVLSGKADEPEVAVSGK